MEINQKWIENEQIMDRKRIEIYGKWIVNKQMIYTKQIETKKELKRNQIENG